MDESKIFQSQEELAGFVDTHDTAELWETMQDDQTRLRVRRRRQSAVRVPVSPELLNELRELARQRHVPLDQLLRDWVTQHLQQEKRVI
ncbi:MAG TPA: CopG family antitoxin [Abditibacteriaceae bacterium]|jgi:hypothetical protein